MASETLTWRHWVQEYVDRSDNPDFKTYAGPDRINDRYIWFVNHLVELGNMRGGRILDIGCGFGWDAAAISLHADSHVVANDIRPEMTAEIETRISDLKSMGAPVRVETLTCDICETDLPGNSFDGIVCQEAIEHIHDLSSLFGQCYRLLKPGGTAVFTNDNNAWNVKELADAEDMWRRRDRDWDYIEQLKRERPIENRGIKPYCEMRRETIIAANPELQEDQVSRLVDATAGMINSDIADLARSYSEGAILPTPSQHSWCRNPETGEYCDRQLDPFEISDMLKEAGFRTTVRHGFRKWPLSWLNGVQLKAFNVRLFQVRSLFIVVARKPN